jgi:hypothetical protein
MQAETGFNAAALATARNRQKEKSKPKQVSAENAKFKSDRAMEKANNAAQAMGKKVVAPPPAAVVASNNASQRSGGGGVGHIAGGKPDWLNLLKILQFGGREAAGGLGAVDFGLGYSGSSVMSAEARRIKNEMVPYEKLPEHLRLMMTKKEYQQQQIRGSEDEEEGSGCGLLPVVVFSFSQKKCEEIADFFGGQDLLNAIEKSEVQKLISAVKKRLNPSDVQLPQVRRIEDMLMRGIGVHHGGLLPILKETVELLFSRSVVKVLLATETFAMGVNMPARSVVFNGFRKHDGKAFRDLLPGEYTQMAGRAGRRGLDKVGTVILAAWQDIPETGTLKTLLTGVPMKLTSQFKLSYNMILNLLRVNDLSVEDMIKRSFSEFRTQRALSTHDLLGKLKTCEDALRVLEAKAAKNDCLFEVPDIENYVQSFENCYAIQQDQFKALYRPEKVGADKIKDISSILSLGRIVYIHDKDMVPSPSMILSAIEMKVLEKKPEASSSKTSVAGGGGLVKTSVAFESDSAAEDSSSLNQMSVWVLLRFPEDTSIPVVSYTEVTTPAKTKPFSEISGLIPGLGVYWIKCVSVDRIGLVMSKKVNSSLAAEVQEAVKSPGASTSKALGAALASIVDACENYDASTELSSLDISKELKISEIDFVSRQIRISSLAKSAGTSNCHRCPKRSSQYQDAFKIRRLKEKVFD